MRLSPRTRIASGGKQFARLRENSKTGRARRLLRDGFEGTIPELAARLGISAKSARWIFRDIRPLVVEVLPRRCPGGSTWKWKGTK